MNSRQRRRWLGLIPPGTRVWVTHTWADGAIENSLGIIVAPNRAFVPPGPNEVQVEFKLGITECWMNMSIPEALAARHANSGGTEL